MLGYLASGVVGFFIGVILSCVLLSKRGLEAYQKVQDGVSTGAGSVKTNFEAAKAAEQDGVRLIYGMDGIPDGIYIDTPENRELIRKGLGLYPDYRNWRDDFDPSFVAELDVMQ